MGLLKEYEMRLGQIPALSRKQLIAPSGETKGAYKTAMPQVDSANAMASLAELMGPTPVEREAAERRMQKNKNQMAAWAGLFDGLRQLGNLYYASKGATPQRYTDNPMGQVEQNYQQQRQLYNDMANYRRQYAQGLYSLRRQLADDERRNKLADAQVHYYGTRDEMARLKAENDRLRAEAAARNTDAKTANTNEKTATEVFLRSKKGDELDTRAQKNRAQAAKAGQTGGGSKSTYGYKTVSYYDENGRKVTERVPTTGGKPEIRVEEPKKPKKPSTSSATNKSGFFNK